LQHPVNIPKLVSVILALLLVGIPVVAFIWETLNHLLSGQVEPMRLLISVPVVGLLYILLRIVARILAKFEEPHPTPR
jgi:hypothetical protein